MASRMPATTSSSSTMATNPYVGTANARPDSLTPRRLTTVSRTTKPRREGDRVRDQRGDRRRDRGDARDHGHRDRQDVVDEQGAGRHEARPRTPRFRRLTAYAPPPSG